MKKINCSVILLFFVIIVAIVLRSAYLSYLEINLERYESFISGEIIEIRAQEPIDIWHPVIYMHTKGASILVRTPNETIEINSSPMVLTKDDLGKEAKIKESWKIKNGQKIRERLTLVSIE